MVRTADTLTANLLEKAMAVMTHVWMSVGTWLGVNSSLPNALYSEASAKDYQHATFTMLQKLRMEPRLSWQEIGITLQDSEMEIRRKEWLPTLSRLSLQNKSLDSEVSWLRSMELMRWFKTILREIKGYTLMNWNPNPEKQEAFLHLIT